MAAGHRKDEFLLARRGGLSMGAGLLLLAAGLGGYAADRLFIPGPPMLPAWAYALAAAAGVPLCLLFSGYLFTKGRDHAEKVRGIGLPGRGRVRIFKSERIELKGLAYVHLEKQVRVTRDEDGENTYISFPVSLMGGRPTLALFEYTDYFRARRSAERLASFLALPLKDRSSGESVVREPEHLNESVGARLRRQGERPDPGDPPPGMLTRVRPGRGGTVMELPAPGFTPLHKALLAVVALVAVLGWFSPGWLAYAFCGAGFLAIVDSALRRLTISASREALEFRSRGLTSSRTRFAADELEELVFTPGASAGPRYPNRLPGWVRGVAEAAAASRLAGRIMARSDKKTHEVRLRVSREEAEYLYRRTLAALAD